MKKVLVTGATGFIGQYVVEALLQTGCQVLASSANAEKASHMSWFNQVTYIPFKMEDMVAEQNLYDFFRQPDLLIHLTWEGLPNYKSDFHITTNLPRHKAFLENLVQHGLKDLVVTGTCFEYGMQEGALKEEQAVYPNNPYGIAKNELRIFLENLQKQHPFLLKWARLFYMYGKGQSQASLTVQLDKALLNGDAVFNMSGGQQVRDFLPAETVAAYLVQVALQQHTSGIVNVCSGQPVTVQQFVEQYLAARGQNITLNLGYYPYPDYEPMQFWGDSGKLQSILQKNQQLPHA